MSSSAFNGKAVFMPLPVQTTPLSGSGRLGLADLERAAQERVGAPGGDVSVDPHRGKGIITERARKAVLVCSPRWNYLKAERSNSHIADIRRHSTDLQPRF
jgi:hypothetical protein